MRPYAIIEAPSNLGLAATGVEQLATRLLQLGLAPRIGARLAGWVEPPPFEPERDLDTLTLNAHAIAAWSPRLADAIEDVIDRGERPVVLGGDCSIVLGAMLALRRRGRYGLLYIDGHADFYQPEALTDGQAASMDLAFATGHGPDLLVDIEGRAPLVRASDVVVFGYRDADEQRAHDSQPLPSEMSALDLATVRARGIERASRDAVDDVARPELDGFFVHVDADVLDDAVMPAVDFRMPGGLSWDELGVVLRTAMAHERAVGLELTIYNPVLDPDSTAGRGLVDCIARALAL